MPTHRVFARYQGKAMKAAKTALIAAAAALAVPMQASADRTIGVSVQASILMGLGVSVGTQVGNQFNVRGVLNGFNYETEVDDDGGNYDGEFELQTAGLMADWHPFKGGFRLTAGLMSNGNQIVLNGRPATGSEFTIGDCTYISDPNDPLRVSGLVDFKSTAPYLGVGWGGNMNGGKGLYGVFDIGVMLSGSPQVDINAAGMTAAKPGQPPECGAGTVDAANDANVQAQVRQAERDAEDESKDFKLWPNIAFGIGWRF